MNSLKDTQERIKKICNEIEKVLLEKNKRYGNSATEPINIFSSADAKFGIRQRLDDKLKRIKTSTKKLEELRKNDVFDIIGYLILYCEAEDWISFEEFLD